MSTTLTYSISNFSNFKTCYVQCEQIKYHEKFDFNKASSDKIQDFLQILKENLEHKNNVKLILKKECNYKGQIVRLCGGFYYNVESSHKEHESNFPTTNCSFEEMVEFFENHEHYSDIEFPQKEYFEKLKEKTLDFQCVFNKEKAIFHCEQLFFHRELLILEGKGYGSSVEEIGELMKKRGYTFKLHTTRM